jgi:hypothetical protein
MIGTDQRASFDTSAEYALTHLEDPDLRELLARESMER